MQQRDGEKYRVIDGEGEEWIMMMVGEGDWEGKGEGGEKSTAVLVWAIPY